MAVLGWSAKLIPSDVEVSNLLRYVVWRPIVSIYVLNADQTVTMEQARTARWIGQTLTRSA